MSVEWFKQLPSAEQRTRSVICGHPIRVRSNLYDAVTEIACQICGREQAVHDNVSRDSVPTPGLGWVGAEKTKTKILSANKLHADKVMSLEQLCAQVTFNNASSIDLHSRCLKLENSLSTYLTTKFIVWRASPTGCAVHSGTIQIPKGSTLLLDGSGAHFTNVTFSGGSVVCTGENYSGTFRNCKFDQCPLYAVHAASVTLTACTLTSGIPALVASGPGTVVILRRCFIQSNVSGVTVEAGATLRAASLRLRGLATGMHMFINDAGSRVELSDSIIRGPPNSGRRSSAFGAFMRGGHLSLLRCGLASVKMGVYALSDSKVEMRGGFVEDCGWAICVAGGGNALVRDVDIGLLSMPDETGVFPVAVAFGKRLAAEGAAGQVERCKLYGSGAFGMHVSYGARGAMHLCDVACAAGGASVESSRSRAYVTHSRVADSIECCKVASAGCTMRLAHCDVRGRGGAVVASGGTLAVVDSKLQGELQAVNGVIAALRGATVALRRCDVRGSGVGVRVMHSTATAVDTRVADVTSRVLGRSQADGEPVCCGAAYVCVGAKLRVAGGAVENCVVGAAVSEGAIGGRGVLEMRGVAMRSYIVGVRVYEGCAVDLRDCEFVAGKCASRDLVPIEGEVGPGPGYECAVIVRDAASVALSGCRFEGNWGDVLVRSRQVARIMDCRFERRATWGVAAGASTCIVSEGDTLVERCRFTEVERGVTSESGKCTVQECEFGPGVREAAVVAVKDSRMAVTKCSVKDGARAFLLKGWASLHARDCELSKVRYGFALEGASCSAVGERVKMRGVAHRVHADGHTVGRPNVELVKCSFAD